MSAVSIRRPVEIRSTRLRRLMVKRVPLEDCREISQGDWPMIPINGLPAANISFFSDLCMPQRSLSFDYSDAHYPQVHRKRSLETGAGYGAKHC